MSGTAITQIQQDPSQQITPSHIEAGSPQDLAHKAFDAFSKAQFKEAQKFLEKISSTSHEKDSKVVLNQLLTEYYLNKGRNPQKLLQEMISLTQDMVHITKAPVCSIKPAADGTQSQIIQLGNIHTAPLNSVSPTSQEQPQATIAGSASQRSSSQNPKHTQQQQTTNAAASGGVIDMQQTHSTIGGSLGGQPANEVNTILLFNIAAMSYQMQQYGQAMSYLIEIMKNLDQAEDFIVLKSMFLLLQILFDLRQSTPAWPVIAFVELKLNQAVQVLQLKQNVKAQVCDQWSDSSSQEESKGGASYTQDIAFSGETLDETILTKNSFSIINASYIRKHAVSPKNMNIHEYRILLQSYKAMFLILQNDITQAYQEIKIANELRAKINQDPVKVNQTINEQAQIQAQGLVKNIKALIHLDQGNVLKSIKNLSFDEKDFPKVHPSCYHNKQTDEHSKIDTVYQKCQTNHPQYYFNNLGVVHLKLHKYNLAMFYFSKALKFLEKSQNGQPQQPYEKENPTEYISNLSSQKTPEILYNYGLALFRVNRYEEAFRCFEKASSTLKHHPRLWYYMGLSVLNKNMKKQQELLNSQYQSDVFQSMISWGNPNYTKILGNNQHRRFLLTTQGDPAVQLKEHMAQYEQSQFEKLKLQQMEILKQQQATSTQKQSKAQQKKEKLAQQAKQSVIPVDSMSLQSAIMYFQNSLIAIESAKQNETNYGIYIKYILRQQALNAAQINTMNQSDNRGAMGLIPQSQSLSDSLNDSTDTQSVQGSDENSLVYDFPQNQHDLNTFRRQITEKIDKKYEVLKKNTHLHLCYLYLITYDYANVIKSGNNILRNLHPNSKTRFQVLQYLAEAYCMQGNGPLAIECLKSEGSTTIDGEIKMKFDNIATGLKETTPVSVKVINLLNQSAVYMCTGQLELAKTCFDQVLESMDLKVQTTDTESKHLIPGYIVNLLVYFYIKTKNYKMARQVLKSRRFLVDTNHIEAVNTGGISVAQKARNKSKTLIKNFT